MHRLLTALIVSAALLGAPSAFADQFTDTSIPLLEPFGGSSTLTVNCSNTSCIFAAWISYYASAAGWVFNVAVGICVIWMLVAGLRVIISGDNAQMRDNAIGQMKAAAFGLMLLVFAGPILKSLNNIGFT